MMLIKAVITLLLALPLCYRPSPGNVTSFHVKVKRRPVIVTLATVTVAYDIDMAMVARADPTRTNNSDTPIYTIDQLAAVTSVPSRTIRFYQAQGALPRPHRVGRVAHYGPEHVE